MYFWRIESLKRELSGGPLPSRRALPYVIGWFGLLSLMSLRPATDPIVPWEWEAVLACYYAIAAGIGAWWSYRANGGAAGADFPSRLLAVWWVLGIRFMVVLIVPIIIVYVILTPNDTGTSYLADIISAFVFTVPYYWRAAVHLRDVARATFPAAHEGGAAEQSGAAA